MRFSNRLKIACSVFMSAIMTNAPSVALANQTMTMIPTSVVVEDISRAQAQQNVQNFLQNADVQKALVQSGLSADEASARVASLSESELRQLSGQVSQARAGGDILVTILVVILIIFLIQRI